MKPLRHITPSLRVYAGTDSLRQLATELDRAGLRRAVAFCGKTIARHSDGLRVVAEALGERYVGVFDDVKAHSPIDTIVTGAERLRALDADAVIAVGGGSAVVTARAASIVFAERRHVHELCTQFPSGKPPVSPRLDKPKLPQFVVATTPTTAYAKAGSAVLDPSQGHRLALFDPKTRAAALFIHPALALTATPPLTKAAAVNAFSMAVQGLESKVRDPLADALLLHALRLLGSNLRRLSREPDDADVRAQLMLAALLAGQGTDYAPTGMMSALSHAIGARLHLDNGLTNAVLLPYTMRFNAPATVQRATAVLDALPGAPDEAGTPSPVARVQALLARLAVPSTLRQIGVTRNDLQPLAQAAMSDWFVSRNARPVRDVDELLALLDAAW